MLIPRPLSALPEAPSLSAIAPFISLLLPFLKTPAFALSHPHGSLTEASPPPDVSPKKETSGT